MKEMQRLKSGTIKKEVKKLQKQSDLVENAFMATAKPAVVYDRSEDSMLDTNQISMIGREPPGDSSGHRQEMESKLDLDFEED